LDNLKSSENNITFERFNFNYNEQTIIVKTDDYFQINVLDYAISFLYSDTQIIDLEQELESYNLRFKFDLYNSKDIFYIFSGNSYIPLDNCNKEESELVCKIKKEFIEENFIKKGNYKLIALNDNEIFYPLNLVFDIIITYNNTKEKQDVFVEVNYPYERETRKNQAIAYRTNIYLTHNLLLINSI